MDFPVRELSAAEFPALLREIPQPPKQIYVRGVLPATDTKLLAVVGSRNYTTYGKQAVEYLISGLKGYPVSVVSGLALGIDGLAHKAALYNNLHTISVPGSGIDDSVLYPRRHRGLAHDILASGGALLSEFDPMFKATLWSFPQRNRIMAGLSHAVLIIEASEKSGTLITARMAADYNRELLVVPGSIFSEGSRGPHQFLKLGATPVTTSEDILEALCIDLEVTGPREAKLPAGLPLHAEAVLTYLTEPRPKDDLIRALNLDAQEANTLFMHLELLGLIADDNGTIRKYL